MSKISSMSTFPTRNSVLNKSCEAQCLACFATKQGGKKTNIGANLFALRYRWCISGASTNGLA